MPTETLNGNLLTATYLIEFSAVPIPSAAWLFGSGLLGLVGLTRRKASANAAVAVFTMNGGATDEDYSLSSNTNYSWAVQSGDVGGSVVPIPPAVWLFGSGLIGLIRLARRKSN